MDIFLSSLKLQNDTKKSVLLLLENENKSSFFGQKIKKFLAKKSTIYCFLALFFIGLPSETTFANETENKTFIATAYYSPLPNQTKYYRWSYEADKKLNGEWIRGSDGTPVFVGMIAAPKNYKFGTKIELDGLGIVSVHDRGGAIVSTENWVAYDRIDIWMGYGDEGLERTLSWGRREITGRIVDSETATSFKFENISNVSNKSQISQTVLEKLKKLGYQTEWKNFSEIILDFQLKNNIVKSADEPGAWNYGPKTTAKLNELYNNFLKNNQIKNINLEEIVIFEENNKITTAEAFELSQNMQTTSIGESRESVKNLQKFLKKMWYFSEEINGVMTLKTLGAIKKYQFDKNLPQTWRTDIPTQVYIRQDLIK